MPLQNQAACFGRRYPSVSCLRSSVGAFLSFVYLMPALSVADLVVDTGTKNIPCAQDPFCNMEGFMYMAWIVFGVSHVIGIGGLFYLITSQTPKEIIAGRNPSLSETLLENAIGSDACTGPENDRFESLEAVTGVQDGENEKVEIDRQSDSGKTAEVDFPDRPSDIPSNNGEQQEKEIDGDDEASALPASNKK